MVCTGQIMSNRSLIRDKWNKYQTGSQKGHKKKMDGNKNFVFLSDCLGM